MADGTVLLLDIALRGAAVVLLLLLAGLLLRGHRRSPAARLGAALAVGVAAYAICAAPGVAPLRTWWHAPLIGLAAGNALVFWLMARALFDDSFRLRRWHGLVWLLFAGGALADFYIARPETLPVGLLLTAGRMGFAVAAIVLALASWRVDLVESRRRLRGFIVLAIALHVLLDALAGLAAPPGAAPPLAALVNAGGLLAITLLIAWPLLAVGGGDLFAGTGRIGITVAPPGPPPAPAGADAKLIEALNRLMTVERVHRHEGLTIGGLALKMGLPEYRLRRLINQGLGFRNFNGFVNFHRIEEAKQALADPAQAEVPVLTIALDAGFQSLGPFNRAFKMETGHTPTDYRRLQLAHIKPLESRDNFEIGKPA